MILHRFFLGMISALALATYTLAAETAAVDVSAQIQTDVPGVTITQVAEHPDVVTPTGN